MAGDINYKLKYQELKLNFKKSVDLAFRLGFVEGSKQASQQATQQKAQEQEANPSAPGQPGGQPPKPDATQVNGPSQPGDDKSAPMPGGATPGQPPQPQVEAEPLAESEHPDGTELDQHISTLESMLSKSEDGIDPQELKSYIASLKQEIELKKSAEAIKGIAKALHKPQFKIGVQASHNLSDSAKQAVSMQQKIVTDIMQKWEQEEAKANQDILKVLGVEGLSKKEK